MLKNITVSFDKILWGWWAKDGNHQEAFEDLLDTIIINKEDLDITPWTTTMKVTHDLRAKQEQLDIIDQCREDTPLEDYLNGCLRWLRAEEEKMKATFDG